KVLEPIRASSAEVPSCDLVLVAISPPEQAGELADRTAGRNGGDPPAGSGRETELGQVAVHQLELLVSNGEPGVLLQVAGGQLEEHGRLLQLALGLDPAAIGLAVGGEAGPVEGGDEAEDVEFAGEALPLGLGRGAEMGRAGRNGR